MRSDSFPAHLRDRRTLFQWKSGVPGTGKIDGSPVIKEYPDATCQGHAVPEIDELPSVDPALIGCSLMGCGRASRATRVVNNIGSSLLILRLSSRTGALLWLLSSACIAQQADFRVHVVDFQYHNVEDANVLLLSTARTRTAMTDASGTVILHDLPQGKYNITISKIGYLFWRLENYDVTVVQDRPLLATLSYGTMGSCALPYHIKYDNTEPHGARLRGSVVDTDSRKPISGAVLALRRLDESKATIISRSKKKGVFEFPDINPGRYVIHVSREFFTDVEVELMMPERDAAVVTVELDLNTHVHVCL